MALVCDTLVLDGVVEFAGVGPDWSPLPFVEYKWPVAHEDDWSDCDSAGESDDADWQPGTKQQRVERQSSSSASAPTASATEPEAAVAFDERRYRISPTRVAVDLATTRVKWRNADAVTRPTYENDFRYAFVFAISVHQYQYCAMCKGPMFGQTRGRSEAQLWNGKKHFCECKSDETIVLQVVLRHTGTGCSATAACCAAAAATACVRRTPSDATSRTRTTARRSSAGCNRR